jgi:Na+/glutamate symporter
VVGGLFFFALALFITTFINIDKDGNMPAMADLLSGNLPLFAGALVVGVPCWRITHQKRRLRRISWHRHRCRGSHYSAPISGLICLEE